MIREQRAREVLASALDGLQMTDRQAHAACLAILTFADQELEREQTYWREGTALIIKRQRQCVEDAQAADWISHAPIGMTEEQARGYLAGRIDALQYALEMMGCPAELDK